jgi:hypothetical protein
MIRTHKKKKIKRKTTKLLSNKKINKNINREGDMMMIILGEERSTIIVINKTGMTNRKGEKNVREDTSMMTMMKIIDIKERINTTDLISMKEKEGIIIRNMTEEIEEKRETGETDMIKEIEDITEKITTIKMNEITALNIGGREMIMKMEEDISIKLVVKANLEKRFSII